MNDTPPRYDWSGKPIPYVITNEFTQYPPKELSEVEKLREENAKLRAELEEQRQATKTWENEAERRSARYTKDVAALQGELKAIYSTEPVAWVNRSQVQSAEIARLRGGQYDSHIWNECKTAFFNYPLIPLPVRKS